MELLAFFTILVAILIFICLLLFKISSQATTIHDLNALVGDMIEAGVSPKALKLAARYQKEHE